MSDAALVILLAALAATWLAFALALVGVRRLRVRRDEGFSGLMILLWRLYSFGFQRLRVEGREHAPARPLCDARGVADFGERAAAGELAERPRPLIVLANHTAGIDPVLIQTALPFEPRWMMAADMRLRLLEPLWRYARIIFVDRGEPDSTSLRTALAHLKASGALGIFPEAHLERPPRHVLPFKPGVGLMVKRSRALVLPVVVDGTPTGPTAWSSLLKRGRCRVRIFPPIDYTLDGMPTDAGAIRDDLERRLREAAGWPASPVRPEVDAAGELRWIDRQTGDEVDADTLMAS
jgi:1-acyl-sn-glycerol-3-phosphate acyltransferase